MDIHRQANPYPHFGVNGGHDGARSNSQSRTRSNEDEALQFLSQEEQECILFFEETIDSLEDELEDGEAREMGGTPLGTTPPVLASTPTTSGAAPSPPHHREDRPANPPKDQDIIDLVRPEPGPALVKDAPAFNPPTPDFQSMAMMSPASHMETRPKREPVDFLPGEYNPPLPSGSQSDSADDGVSYHPVGSVPTPVLIAQKIAENQGGDGGAIANNAISSSRLRRRSLDSVGPANQPPAKQGPPTSTKPTRFPGNISLLLGGNKEQHGQSLASVNVQERQAQMLANLSGTSSTSYPVETAEAQSSAEPQQQTTARNLPTRSVSFRDPTPDKSRMEALSKLGLSRNRAKSGGMSITFTPNPAAPPPAPPPAPTPAPTPAPADPTSSSARTFQMPPPPPPEMAAPPPPEVGSLDFNSYGGKSIVVHPSATSKSAVVAAGNHDGKVQPPGSATPSDFNSYGGKSKVMTPGPPAVRSDLPDILASHRALPPPASIPPPPPVPAPSKPDGPPPYELNPYGGKTRTVTPSSSSSSSSSSAAQHCTPDVTTHSPAPTPTRSPAPPSPAPKPPRHQAPSPHRKTSLPGSSPEARSKSVSKPPPSFRSQGITVQFSGRGATDESRREALRKLGLLRETS